MGAELVGPVGAQSQTGPARILALTASSCVTRRSGPTSEGRCGSSPER